MNDHFYWTILMDTVRYVGGRGFEPRVIRSQSGYVGHYTSPRISQYIFLFSFGQIVVIIYE